jgi:hypothetical protein
MLTIRQFADFLNLLKSEKAYNGKGNKIKRTTLRNLLNEITEVKSPYRAEHLDAKFKTNTITYHKINPNGTTIQVTEPLEDHLTSDKIDLNSWLKNANSQGLPKPDTQDGDLYFWHPRKDRVAGFIADSGWAGLDCDGDPAYSGPRLGVRVAHLKK